MIDSVLERNFKSLEDGRFELEETTKNVYTMSFGESMERLQKIKVQIESVEPSIEKMKSEKERLIKLYNDGLEILQKAKEMCNADVELPEMM